MCLIAQFPAAPQTDPTKLQPVRDNALVRITERNQEYFGLEKTGHQEAGWIITPSRVVRYNRCGLGMARASKLRFRGIEASGD
jgi:hypothetical protein